MNWIMRIATVFIVIALGIVFIPSANAFVDGNEKSKVKKTYNSTNFTGFRISANPAETLLNHMPQKENIPSNQKSDKSETDLVCNDKSNVKNVWALQVVNEMPVYNSNCCKQKKTVQH